MAPPPPPVDDRPVFDEPNEMAEEAEPPAPPAPPAPVLPDNIGASEDPSYRKMRPPRYPPAAMRRRLQGEVVLVVTVGIDGSPLKVEIHKSSRHRELDQEAMKAVRLWKFNPEKRDGRPVEGRVLVPIKFTLNS